MKKILLSAALSALAIIVYGQVSFNKTNTSFTKLGSVRMSDVTQDWYPSLQSAEPADLEGDEAELIQIKEQLMKKYPQGGQRPQARVQSGGIPYVHINFQGNIIQSSVPNDNTMAIGNDGKVLSAINSTINIYATNPNSQLKSTTLHAFSNTLGIAGSKYDPKLLYDPQADKFILVYLNASTPTTSRIIICFSATNDPMGTWNFYSLNGNPKNDTTWTDFPQIAVTGDELFITVNAIIPGLPWQTGFKQTYIWQMNKNEGYAGNATVTSRLWDEIKYNGNYVRYFTPVGGGSQVYGPNLYFVSSKNFAIQSDTLFLAEITGTQSDVNTRLNIQLLQTDTRYSTPPDALQASGTFATNDARVSGAFYENNKIQYVLCTLDTITGFPAVYHGIVDNISSGTPSVHGEIIGDNVLGFGYPNLAYTGLNGGDNSAIIGFNHSATTVFPGVSALSFDGTTHSSIIQVKAGLTIINALTATQERWGDYFGAQRRYNEPGAMWIAGTYGYSQTYGTWIAELKNTPVGISGKPNVSNAVLYPNPVLDLVKVNFTNREDNYLYFEIYSMDGKMVHNIYESPAYSGENEFQFSTASLASGVYYLKIRNEKETILTQKIEKL